jgi:hypothetical protein
MLPPLIYYEYSISGLGLFVKFRVISEPGFECIGIEKLAFLQLFADVGKIPNLP